jgi:hypothetical protein
MSCDFSFVFDERIRRILDRDYDELERLDPRAAPKSVLVLSGGIIEGLLFVIREVKNWAVFEAARRKIRRFLTQLNQDQRDLLLLFSTAKPLDPKQSDHPFLRHGVYRSTASLIVIGI